eukprot:2681420-Pyramimonas_sp.AAC.1
MASNAGYSRFEDSVDIPGVLFAPIPSKWQRGGGLLTYMNKYVHVTHQLWGIPDALDNDPVTPQQRGVLLVCTACGAWNRP